MNQRLSEDTDKKYHITLLLMFIDLLNGLCAMIMDLIFESWTMDVEI
jgi:hypothetical protein